MTRSNQISIGIGLLTTAILLAHWQFQQHLLGNQDVAAFEKQAPLMEARLETNRLALAQLEKRNHELEEAERRAGNQTLVSLMRERNAVSLASGQAESKTHSVRNVLAGALENPEQQQLELEYLRNQGRAGLSQFFKLKNVPPEKQEQYIDLQIAMEQRQTARLSALLQGKMTVAEARSQQESDQVENERRRREVLGEEAITFLDGVSLGLRTDKIMENVQEFMGDERLNQAQSDQLKPLLAIYFRAPPIDDIDVFRPPAEWEIIRERQKDFHIRAVDFLTPAQSEKLKQLGSDYLDQKIKDARQKRKELGIR
jgi:hypothetical protein